MNFVSFNNSSLTNYCEDKSNFWRTSCLSVSNDPLDSEDVVFALSAECLNENVPFAKTYASKESEQHDKNLFMRNMLFPFYTVSIMNRITPLYKHGNYWQYVRTLSSPNEFVINPDEEPLPNWLKEGDCINDLEFGCLRRLDINSSWPKAEKMGLFEDDFLILNAGGAETRSIISIEYIKHINSINIDHFKDFIHGGDSDVRELTAQGRLCCCLALPPSYRRHVSFPVRYINFNNDYIQVITGTIAFNQFHFGKLCFAYRFSDKSILSEVCLSAKKGFSKDNSNDIILSSTSPVFKVNLLKEKIYFYIEK